LFFSTLVVLLVLKSGNRYRANHFSAANTGFAQTFSIGNRFVSPDSRAVPRRLFASIFAQLAIPPPFLSRTGIHHYMKFASRRHDRRQLVPTPTKTTPRNPLTTHMVKKLSQHEYAGLFDTLSPPDLQISDAYSSINSYVFQYVP
tara:strand:- start:10767 stop:11201 length:435 start_codon:yes stop_codon:yes gene_type:complete